MHQQQLNKAQLGAADIGCMALYKAALPPLGAAASLPHLARLILHEGSVGLQLRTNAVLISERWCKKVAQLFGEITSL